jgi:hypothetical protein
MLSVLGTNVTKHSKENRKASLLPERDTPEICYNDMRYK